MLVEPMHPSTRQYGTDVKRQPMRFGDFLASLSKESGPYYYLTTQYSGEEWDHLTMFSPPTDALRGDFPNVPRLMGNLFVQQVNLWLGKSQDGSSSGLHHDFHDNLYCLLRGRKRFVLYPPQEYENLYPNKPVEKVHPNGVIAYEWLLRADGLDHRIALKARVDALRRLLDDPPAETSKGKGKGKAKATSHAMKEHKRLEEEFEEAREELVKLSLSEEYGFPLDDAGEDSEDEDEDEDDEGNDFGSLAGDLEEGQDDYDALMGDLEAIGDRAGSSGPNASGARDADDESLAEEEPASFSRIPTARLHQHLCLPTTAVAPAESTPTDFADLAKAGEPFIVELAAGEALYLPASWWHEVTSSSASDDGEADVHMAFNYWFYPPDGGTFEEPYMDKLVWSQLRAQTQKADTRPEQDDEHGKDGKRKHEEEQDGLAKKIRR